MKRLTKFSVGLSIAFILFSAGETFAKQHDHLKYQQNSGSLVSPFSLKKTSAPHCLLMSKSHHRKGECPHLKTRRYKTTTISIDCEGKTAGSIPNLSTYTSNFWEAHLSQLTHPTLIKTITIISSFPSKHYLDLSVPPPRFVQFSFLSNQILYISSEFSKESSGQLSILFLNFILSWF